jgi:hypothetical protein
MEHESITDLHERELVRRLLLSPISRGTIIDGIYGMPRDPVDLQQVGLGDAPGDFRGDVDILLCSQGKPEEAVAIEVKRIKCGADAVASGKPNKLGELENGASQANRLAKVGFWKVFYYPIIVVDTRERDVRTDDWDGLPRGMQDLIRKSIASIGSQLQSRIGLFRTEYTQPWDHAPLGEGMFVGELIRNARPVTQPKDLTAWVARKFGL